MDCSDYEESKGGVIRSIRALDENVAIVLAAFTGFEPTVRGDPGRPDIGREPYATFRDLERVRARNPPQLDISSI